MFLGVVAGGVITFVVAKIFKPQKRIAYSIVSDNYINLEGDESGGLLKVQYAGEEIRNFHRTYCVIWNPSETPVSGSDLSESWPLALSFPTGSRILEVRPRAHSRASVDQNFKICETKVEAFFSLLNQRDYISVEVYWTVEGSETSENPKPELEGVISGVNSEFEVYPFYQVVLGKPAVDLSPVVISLTTLMAAALIVSLVWYANQSDQPAIIYGLIAISVILFLAWLGVSNIAREFFLTWYRRKTVFPAIGSNK